MAAGLTAPPVLSTPETHILSETVAPSVHDILSDEQLHTRYEISRTIEEIRQRRWKRIALQFPDQMLPHSARVYQLLARGLQADVQQPASKDQGTTSNGSSETVEVALSKLSIQDAEPVRLTILGDTSYGSCCVDEIAAEHVDADAVIHYGRACLSPTARLPVLHIYTTMDLDLGDVVESFQEAFPDPASKVVLTADVPYSAHVQRLLEELQQIGYINLHAASIVHDPSSAIPNRTVPTSVSSDASSLSGWSLFHISDPPTSLLLTLHSRMASIRIYPTNKIANSSTPSSAINLETSTSQLLRRRYALITSLTTVSTWGILINTLSVQNYLSMLSHIQSLISGAGKKSYLFVVGKLSPAKLANFSEIGGWVVIGCWESSLVDSRDFFRPIITPFELEMALMGDESRVWTGEWRADFQRVLEDAEKRRADGQQDGKNGLANVGTTDHDGEIDMDSASEDEPPEFDLRTGRYVSRTRPMQRSHLAVHSSSAISSSTQSSTALTRKSNGALISINGIASPAAEYLAQQRSWRGLGSDFEIKYEEDGAQEGDLIEEGRTGVARGYTIGEDESKT
ncbi:Diphthamide biosynthesis protein 2 [Cladophialophora chaetospira]|uniref:2-(3-amino-3-carboxypropyl)histidine synthase subunit 2 n=1 Tax=Cladophialophora chaetospira TaxID=386627 RepID=A0AA39CFL7_9EURO|nr:Diphthamide biosynthesis protein 2 [Cladophialophora chaetospira]